MSRTTTKPSATAKLRELAQSRLARPLGLDDSHTSATAALRVLHELASSPDTAADALALLHELQVHQVELDLQTEELRDARIELETALARQQQLYDAAPVAYLVLDAQAQMLELNATGVQLLGGTRERLHGQGFERFLVPASRTTLQGLLARARQENSTQAASLVLQLQGQPSHTVAASVCRDPAGSGYLLVLGLLPLAQPAA